MSVYTTEQLARMICDERAVETKMPPGEPIEPGDIVWLNWRGKAWKIGDNDPGGFETFVALTRGAPDDDRGIVVLRHKDAE